MELFDKKMCRECQVRLQMQIRVMIQNDMHVLFNLKIDDLGERLMQLPQQVAWFPDQSASICGKLALDMYVSLNIFFNKYAHSYVTTETQGSIKMQ